MLSDVDYRRLSDELRTSHRVRVDSIADAVLLAQALKESHVYDIFRGQSNATWTLSSSAERRVKNGSSVDWSEVEKLNSLYAEFYRFAQRTPEMEKYLDNHDSLMAIAQHYGMVHELIPSQLVRRVEGEGDAGLETWIAFSPIELQTLGLA